MSYIPTPAEQTIQGLCRAILDLDLDLNMGLERAAELAAEIQRVAEQQASKPHLHPTFEGLMACFAPVRRTV